MNLLLLPLGALVIIVAGHRQPDCSRLFQIGQTYKEIQAGPCPDIAAQASFKVDSTHVAYYCPSKNVMVVGSIVTGKMEAFFLYRPE